MHKIDKFLAKIDEKDRKKILWAIQKLQTGATKSLDIKKLKGYEEIYRIRMGNYRVVFEMKKTSIIILTISKRDEMTYNI